MQLINFKEANCKNCYRCVRACPVKAIKFKNHQAIIDDKRCIACGQCFVVCPQNARDVKSDLLKIEAALRDKTIKVVALIAPSFTGFYMNKGGFVSGLKQLGFDEVVEVSVGAERVTKNYSDYLKDNDPFYAISSCCPTINLLVRRYYSELTGSLLPVVSPMLATGKMVKKENPESYTVFISPCLSKKCEPLSVGNENIIDGVLSMEEVNHLFMNQNINPEDLIATIPDVVSSLGGSEYPIKGGIGKSLGLLLEEKGYDLLHVEGINQVKDVLDEMVRGDLSKAFIELSACSESCISGPLIPSNSIPTFRRKQLVRNHAKEGWGKPGRSISFEDINLKTTYEPSPVYLEKFSEEEIVKTLSRMGKRKKEDELDCGACGYNNCRDKARAVLEGMSEVTMCMPFMQTKAEHMRDIIFYNSPNMIFLLDENLSILQINPSAEITFHVKAENMKNIPMAYLLNDDTIEKVWATQKSDLNRRMTYEAQELVVMQSIIYLSKDNQILIIMADITDEENRRKELLKMKENTVKITQDVIEKQMRVAHEIASLLGETTAETKVALNKLKAIVMEEGEIS